MKNNTGKYFKNDLTQDYLGEVIDIEDPLFLGRVRIKIFGLFDEIEDPEHIPWARMSTSGSAGSSTGNGNFSVPKLNTIVHVKFPTNNIYEPVYTRPTHHSEELLEEIGNEESYPNAHSLIYDTVTEGGLKVFFTEPKGFIIEYNDSRINLSPEQFIKIHGKISGEDTEPAVLGNTLHDLLSEFIDDMGKLVGLTTPGGPASAFSSMPGWQLFSNKWKKKFELFKSNTIEIDTKDRNSYP